MEAYYKAEWKNIIVQSDPHINKEGRDRVIEARWSDFRQDWQRVIYVTSELECDAAWINLSTKWIESNRKVVVYLDSTWIIHKEKFYAAWTA